MSGAINLKEGTNTTAYRLAEQGATGREVYTPKQARQMAAALLHIVNHFDKLNGGECSRNCGECIRCIAWTGLTGLNPKLRDVEHP